MTTDKNHVSIWPLDRADIFRGKFECFEDEKTGFEDFD